MPHWMRLAVPRETAYPMSTTDRAIDERHEVPRSSGRTGAERICMLLTNPFEHDSRVLKEGATLAAAGYDVRLVAIAAPGLSAHERRDGIRVTRVSGLPRTMALVEALRTLRARVRRERAAEATTATEPTTDPGEPSLSGHLTSVLVRVRSLAGSAYGVLAWWRFARGALHAACDAPADVVLAHDLNTLPIAALAARRLRARLLYDSHEVFAELPVHSPLARRRWLAVERALLGRVDAMWMSSPGHAEVFAANHGVPVPPVVMNVPSLKPDPRANGIPDLHSDLSLAPGLRLVLYVGGINPHRPLESLLEVARVDEGCAVVIMGPGLPGYVERLRARAAELGLADRVRIVPPVPVADVVRYAAAGDVGVIPFLNTSLNNLHGLPNKVFEYIAAGVPVVASDFPQLRAVIEGEDVGVTYDPDCPGALEEAVTALLADPERLARMRTNALAASERLNWESESGRVLEIVARGDGAVARQAAAVTGGGPPKRR